MKWQWELLSAAVVAAAAWMSFLTSKVDSVASDVAKIKQAVKDRGVDIVSHTCDSHRIVFAEAHF